MGVRRSPTHLVVVVMIVTLIAVIAVKAWVGRGTPLRGGLPSGHAAAAFAGWAAMTIIAEPLRHAVARVHPGVPDGAARGPVAGRGRHPLDRGGGLAGAVLGTCVAIIIFQLWG